MLSIYLYPIHRYGLLTILLSFLLTFMVGNTTAQASVNIAQQPVFMVHNIPGNLLLVPSVEWPTINSVANLGNYSTSQTYAGYFDSHKCYEYHYSANEAERHFYPVSTTTTRTCSGTRWSGNFLNWAATQTIDPFRSALTGGYRVKDTPTETWLEKARHDGQGGTNIYPNRRLPNSGNNSTVIAGATPFTANWMRMRIEGLGNQMRFRLGNDDVNHNVTAYNPSATLENRAYTVSIRVKVCDPSVGVESNCKQYSQGWKPEGTIQQYASGIRYGIFGYLNDHSFLRDGGVLRAQQKFVGPTITNTDGTVSANPHREWDPTTGVLIANPNSADATATNAPNIQNSGVINYLNKFGQMTGKNHKNHDPVSELYYTAIRYYKNLGNVSAYSTMSGTNTERYELADGFPVITNWNDPILHWCQNNVILGIGDIYTHRDKNLPGNTNTSEEPARPSEVSSDNTVNVVTATQKVAQLEGITINTPFTGRNNSAYMAGLAYDSHTKDIRPDLTGGKTTVSTYWVDVLEEQSLEGMARNQFALAAKYGGFRVPEDFDPYARTEALPLSWWHSSGEILTPFGSRGAGQAAFPRPDNYFVAGEANTMVSSLRNAFSQIFSELSSSSASAAASASVLQADTLIYTAGFRSSDWSGTFTARRIYADGSVSDINCAQCWDAEARLAARTSPRNIFTRAVGTPGSGSGGGVSLTTWNSLHTNQQAALNHKPDNTSDTLGEARLDWLRGTEHSSLRSRMDTNSKRLLGDIIHSDPQYKNGVLYVGANDGMLHAFDATSGEELFAYIPSELLLPEPGRNHAPLSRLMSPDYTHRYFMDGTPAIAEVTLSGAAKTVLVSSMGAGGRSLFALDVSSPESFSASNVLWEFRDPDLGYRSGTPAVVRMNDGTWAVVTGNGYNSDSGKAFLFVINLATGALIKKIPTNDATANGLATPFVTDWPERNLRAQRIYAGDLLGNLWAFDVSGNASQWDNQNRRRILFTATDAADNPQPITSRPYGARTSDSEAMIVVGTGSYFRTQDANDNQVQSLYGIVDYASVPNNPPTVVRANLLEQKIIYQGAVGDKTLRVVSDYTIEETHKGWFIDLDQETGERVISGPRTLGRDEQRVRFSTIIPDEDPCGTGLRGFLMDIGLLSGGRTEKPVFDLDKDGYFDEDDMLTITVDGETITVPPSGLELGSGGEAPLVIDVRDETTEDTQLICDGQGNCEIGRPGDDRNPGRQSWQQLR